jgi:uroporphyrinogen-III decarboxylase
MEKKQKNWSELSSDEKREDRFNRWLSPGDVTFSSPEAEKLYKQRVSRIIDAIKLKEPDRVPVVYSPGHVPARYSGYTIKEVMYDPDKLVRAWEKYMNDFELDVLPSPAFVRSGKVLDLLDSKMTKWPGHGLGDDYSPQYVETECLKADEWDVFQQDPSDFNMRIFLPRIYGAALPFKKLPPLRSAGSFLKGMSAFTDPEVLAAFKIFRDAEEEDAKWQKAVSAVDSMGLSSGLPQFDLGFIIGGAPLDSIGAALRGTKGTIMDMFQQPERLIEYMEKEVPATVKRAAGVADMTGVPLSFMPLHRGADGFMSEKQFHTFYWPYLKRVILGCIEEGLVPFLFAEGSYNTRLEIVKDLPKGKVIWHFDQTDMARANQIIGKYACLMGNVPTSLLVTGNPKDIKSYCRKLIETAGKGGGYIMAPGATADNSKPENLYAMLEAAKEFGVYRK